MPWKRHGQRQAGHAAGHGDWNGQDLQMVSLSYRLLKAKAPAESLSRDRTRAGSSGIAEFASFNLATREQIDTEVRKSTAKGSRRRISMRTTVRPELCPTENLTHTTVTYLRLCFNHPRRRSSVRLAGGLPSKPE